MRKPDLIDALDPFTAEVEIAVALPDGRRVPVETGRLEIGVAGEGFFVLHLPSERIVTSDRSTP
jgi:hypothetical protein